MSKKVDVSFMKFVYTDAEWTREVAESAGALCIIDVYTKNWGPCEMIAGHFSNYFFDLGEQYSMKFVRAEADKVAALAKYRDQSKPCFLFWVNGEEVAQIEGPDIPAILETIKTKAPAAAA